MKRVWHAFKTTHDRLDFFLNNLEQGEYTIHSVAQVSTSYYDWVIICHREETQIGLDGNLDE